MHKNNRKARIYRNYCPLCPLCPFLDSARRPIRSPGGGSRLAQLAGEPFVDSPESFAAGVPDLAPIEVTGPPLTWPVSLATAAKRRLSAATRAFVTELTAG